MFFLQPQQKIYDLRLNRHVKRGRGLIAQQNRRRGREGSRDNDALKLTTGKGPRPISGTVGAETHHADEFGDTCPFFGTRSSP
ncbi:hypothetical protein GCM10017788_65430 [Amycolatopsis acidiphila]|nr:hypothetical protein GCM10017788_65430 [Amycolatopsis acidiphila]